MGEPLSVRDVDDIGFQETEWTVQRVGWVVLALVLLAASVGYLGAGPVSERTVESADGSLTVEYERFIRHVGTTTATLEIGPPAVQDGTATLYISRDLIQGWRVENVTPTPSTESSSADWLIYEFDVLGETPPRVKLLYRGDGFGRHQGAIRAGDGAPVEVSQWIYP